MEENIKHLKEVYESRRNQLIEMRKTTLDGLRQQYSIQIDMYRGIISDLDKILNSKTKQP